MAGLQAEPVPEKIFKNACVSMYLVRYTVTMQRYEIETYETETGKVPFEDWLDAIKSKDTQAQIVARIQRAKLGNFGDWKALAGANGLFEMRIHSGQGFRIFYTVVGRTVILLLAGSTKKEQDRTLAKAMAYLEDYNRRVKA